VTIVGIVSDTHLPRFGRSLPAALVTGLRGAAVHRIVHLGDWTAPFVLDLLAEIAPTDGVAGNNDPPALLQRLGPTRVLDVEGVRLGLTHGHLGHGRTTRERALGAFAGTPGIRAVLFGHSHIPVVEHAPDGRWLVNPGSPTDRRRQPRYTWATMRVDGDRVIDVALHAFEDRRA
jgi:putative phosphoesterase